MALVAGGDPSLLTVAEVAALAQTESGSGLTATEAAARLANDGPNILTGAPPVPAWRRLLAQFRDPLIYLLLVAIAISLVAWIAEGRHGIPYDAVIIAIVVLANAFLGFAQERKAQSAVAALQRMSAPGATVLRDGVAIHIAARDLVVGDVLLLAEGDAIAADARITASSLSVAEAALTGESAPVAKVPEPLAGPAALGDRTCMVYAGTAVTRGSGRAIVIATGMDTETGRIAQMLEATVDKPTPLQIEIASLGKTLGRLVVAIAVVVIVTVLLTSEVSGFADIATVLLLGVALAVAAVPEGLPAILSVVLAMGVQRMAARNAIVKDLDSVETLGSASVVCSDKTGTLTQNVMTVARVVTAAGELEPDAPPARESAAWWEAAVVVSGGSLASDAHGRTTGDQWAADGDPTEVAFLTVEHAWGMDDARASRFTRIADVPFDSARKLMSVVATDARATEAALAAGPAVLVAKGAPDVLLARCTQYLEGQVTRPLDDARRGGIVAQIERMSSSAMRTLGVAYRPATANEAAGELGDDPEHHLVWAGAVGISDPARPEAHAAVAIAQSAGVRIVMITGDHPLTALSIAVDLGIVPAEPSPRVVSGPELSLMDDAALAAAVSEASVFARVAPEHKLRIVGALQERGDVVAMTGDGVNDAPALRAADIGVAMGQGGTEVAREASNMVLADDNFATIVAAIREGRGILDNIARFFRFLLASNLGEVLVVFVGVLGASWLGLDGDGAAIAVPLLATQILWINLLTDMAPALAMAAEPYADDLMERRPRAPHERLVNATMWRGMLFTAVVMAVSTLAVFEILLPGGWVDGAESVDTARTAGFTTLVFANLAYAFSARSATKSALTHLFTNPWLWGAVTLSVLLQVAVVNVPVLNRAFSTTPLTLGQWALCAGLALAVPVAVEVRKWVGRMRAARR